MNEKIILVVDQYLGFAVYRIDQYDNRMKVTDGPDLQEVLLRASMHLGRPIALELKP